MTNKKVQNGVVDGLVFDVTGITGREVFDFQRVNKGVRVREQAAIMASYAVSCPEGWGPVRAAETFSHLPFLVFRKARNMLLRDLDSPSEDQEIEGLAFDVETILADEVQDFYAAVGEYDIEKTAPIMAKYTIQCPEGWGEKDQPETFANRPWPEFSRAVLQFSDVIKDLAKN